MVKLSLLKCDLDFKVLAGPLRLRVGLFIINCLLSSSTLSDITPSVHSVTLVRWSTQLKSTQMTFRSTSVAQPVGQILECHIWERLLSSWP